MRPVNLVGFNAAYQKPYGQRRRIVSESVRLGAVIAGVETKGLMVSSIVGPGFSVFQRTNAGDAYAGTCLILNPIRVQDVRNVNWVLAVAPTRNAEMLTRYTLEADILIEGHWRSIRISHAPPARYFWLWATWARNVRKSVARARHPVWLFADFNARRLVVRAAFGMMARMIGVMGWCLSPGERAGKARGEEVGSDHKTVVVLKKGEDDD